MQVAEEENEGFFTYIMEPRKFVKFGIWLYEALKVNVIALLDVVGIERGSHF